MSKARMDGLYLLILGSAVFFLLGMALESASPSSLTDFKTPYYCARCLLQHCDPYKQGDVMRLYMANGGAQSLDSARNLQIITRYVYPPTAFIFTLPFAMLPWGPAHFTWIALLAGSMILGSFLMWQVSADGSPLIIGCILGFFVANCELLIIIGNPAGIVIGFCAVAAWCFIRERFVTAGVICLALSLALKPQDAGFVWLYFLLAGGVYRKRALQALAVVAALGLPALLWVSYASPHWIQELHSNLSWFTARGGINDPGPTSTGAHRLGMIVNLQTVVSLICDNPNIYNAVTYVLCAPLLAIWTFFTLRSRPSPKRAWLALASIAPFTMLPVFHRQYDAKLLLLTIPACAILWARGGVLGRLAILLTAAGIILTGDLTWALAIGIVTHLNARNSGGFDYAMRAAQILPVPLILLTMSVFYIWAYVQPTRIEE